MGDNKATKGLLKGILSGIKDYANIQAERQKITGDLLSNQIKSQQNWLYKMQESQVMNPLEQEKLKNLQSMRSEYEGQQGMSGGAGTAVMEQGADAFANPVQSQVQPTGGGEFTRKYISPKQGIFMRIQEKEKQGFPLTKAETQFKNNYLGIKEEKKPDFNIEREARARVNMMLKFDTTKQLEAMSDPGLIDRLVSEQISIIKGEKPATPQSDSIGMQEPLPQTFPGNVKTTSQAVQYLISNYGIDKETAISHIKTLLQNTNQ